MNERKDIRLKDFDYTAGTYFVTVCAKDRRNIFGQILPNNTVGAAISRPIELTNCGTIVENAIAAIPVHYPNITLNHFVVMPNHVHMLLTLNETAQGRLIAAPTLSTVIGHMKRWCSKEVGASIWQKSFYEHGVRNQQDFLEILRYIEENPVQWQLDKYFQA